MDREKVIRIIDELIFEAQKAPTWKAENALRCLKKELLKEQEAVVQCKDCAYLNRDPRFMNYGYCSYFKDKFYVNVNPDRNFYCGAGKRQP